MTTGVPRMSRRAIILWEKRGPCARSNDKGMMNINRLLMIGTLGGLLTTATSVGQGFGQVVNAPPKVPRQSVLAAEAEANLPRFDLDFPGGTPGELVSAIEKSMGKPLNAVIPVEANDVRFPRLKMRDVNVAELFKALSLATQKNTPYQVGHNGPWQTYSSSSAFQTEGPLRGDSVWYFQSFKPPILPPTRVCRFWQLAPFLETYKVDDITTAVQTGYKMLGESAPEISFHKDTKLLIAVGEASQLALIDEALNQLKTLHTGQTGKPALTPSPKVGSASAGTNENRAN